MQFQYDRHKFKDDMATNIMEHHKSRIWLVHLTIKYLLNVHWLLILYLLRLEVYSSIDLNTWFMQQDDAVACAMQRTSYLFAA